MINLRRSLVFVYLVLGLSAVAFGVFAQDDDQLIPIAELETPLSEVDLTNRCYAFTQAIFIYARLLAHNPVYGTYKNRKAPFYWAELLERKIWSERKAMLTGYFHDTQNYMDRFGPVIYPSLLTNKHLYQSDKETCLEEFGMNTQ